jgi:hypothetical protein
MNLWARHSDATRERVAHVGLPLLLTAAALGVCGYMDNPYVTIVALVVAAIGIFCTFIGVIPGRAKREPQVRNCASGNLEIPRCAIAHLRSGSADHPGMTA